MNFYKMPRNVQLLVRCCCGGRAWKCVVTTQEDLGFFFIIIILLFVILLLDYCISSIVSGEFIVPTLLFSTLASWEASPLGWK